MMKMAKSLLAISLISCLSACGGGSGGASSVADATPAPTPVNSTPPPVTSSGNEMILRGSSEFASGTESVTTFALVASDMDTIIVAQDRGLLLKVSLSADAVGSIDTEGELYSGAQTAARSVQVTGTVTDDNYSLTISGDTIDDLSMDLAVDMPLTNSQPAHSGYYELEAEQVYSTALVLNDGELTGNDTDQCRYSGSYQTLRDNLLHLNVQINNIEPFICPSTGEYTGLAASLNDAGDDQAFLMALHNERRAIVSALPKVSDELAFAGLQPGLYFHQTSDDQYIVNFGVSHDGTLRGNMVSNAFGGHFNAEPRYMGAGYAFYDDNVRFYDRTAWVIMSGNFAIADTQWQRRFEQPSGLSAARSELDAATLYLTITEPNAERQYETELQLYRQTSGDFPVQFSDFVGRYNEPQVDIDLTLSADGTLSGVYQLCNVSGNITERTDTAAQEFATELTFEGCPASNNFAIDGNYSGFGFANLTPSGEDYEMTLFIRGSTASQGVVSNVFRLDPSFLK